ncbi:amidase signature enzyme [Ophiobolus disseminans]|uniref:Amidase signature enzyme n=1 Tax=Ophiobolus disseminans TaxID=1469910 RepID=A0A6A7AK94_9PLEO|nr:amidase signature enzyme [Ophiobolus disseminans]
MYSYGQHVKTVMDMTPSTNGTMMSRSWRTLTISAPLKLWLLTATEILRLTSEDEVSVEDYAKALSSRVELRDSVVKAWQYLDRELVLTLASDMPTEYGSLLYKGNMPNADASSVDILRRAGALIFGKTTTTEFAIVNSGPDNTNPHDSKRTPGGSSAGSAAAVTDFQVPLSCGTQTGGSVIRPALYMDTYVLALELDTFGYFARSVEDLKLITDVFKITTDESIKNIPLREAKVGYLKTPIWLSADPGTIAVMEKAAKILLSYGVTVEEKMIDVIMKVEAHASFLNEYLMDTTKTKLNLKIHGLVEKASDISHDDNRRAYDSCVTLRPLLDQIAAKYSVLIMSSAVDEAPLGLEDMGAADSNFVWTAAHMPVIQIPAFAGPNGMPVGLSLVARRYCDQDFLNIAQILGGPLMSKRGWQSASRHAG